MYLLDTNVLSEVMKRTPNRDVIEKLTEVQPDALFTSPVCIMEIRFGCLRAGKGEKFWARIVDRILVKVGVLALTGVDGVRAGEVMAGLAKKGRTISVEDVLIAATALERDLVLVTRNEKHFREIPGLKVENWFGD